MRKLFTVLRFNESKLGHARMLGDVFGYLRGDFDFEKADKSRPKLSLTTFEPSTRTKLKWGAKNIKTFELWNFVFQGPHFWQSFGTFFEVRKLENSIILSFELVLYFFPAALL